MRLHARELLHAGQTGRFSFHDRNFKLRLERSTMIAASLSGSDNHSDKYNYNRRDPSLFSDRKRSRLLR